MKNFSCRKSSLSLAIGLLAAATQAAAQSNTLETIVVTAERQQSELRTIPASVYGVDSELLESIAHTHIAEVLNLVPGVVLSRNNGQEHLTAIRSPVLSGAGSCGAFQMSQDGIPLRSAGFCNVNQLFEANTEQASRIEVVRGPGSVLYGVNALHGAINVISPELPDMAGGNVALDFGPHSYRRVKVGLHNNFDGHALGLFFNGTSDGGYKDDSGFDQQKLNIQHRYRGPGYQVTTMFDATNLNQDTAGYLQAGFEAYKISSLKKQNPNPEAYRDAKSYRLHSRIEGETLGGSWMLTPYVRKTDMDFLMHFLPGAPLEENGLRSFGIQSMYSFDLADNMQWLAGVDYEYTEGYLRQTQAGPAVGTPFVVGTLPVGKQYDFDVDATMISPYGQLRHELDERNALTFGLRYEFLKYQYDNNMIAGRTREDGTPCGFGGCRYSRPEDRNDNFNNFSAQLGWVHDFDTSQQVFANLSRAFRAPQATEMYRLQNEQLVADLDSEEVDGVEFGYRASRERASYGLAAYYLSKDNVVFQDSDRNNVSDGKTKHRGIEFNSHIALSAQLSLNLVATYSKHTHASDIAPLGVTVAIDGNDISSAPRRTGSAMLRWQPNSRNTVELEWLHMGSYYLDETNDHAYAGHDVANLRYSYDRGENWYFAARVTNLFDTDYAERADLGFGQYRYFVGEPVSLYVTLGARF